MVGDVTTLMNIEHRCRTGRVGCHDSKEAGMTDHEHHTPITLAIFTLAAIKTATDAFESGDSNLHDALDTIIEAIDEFRAGAADCSRREAASRGFRSARLLVTGAMRSTAHHDATRVGSAGVLRVKTHPARVGANGARDHRTRRTPGHAATAAPLKSHGLRQNR
jgi:hypothetical protein